VWPSIVRLDLRDPAAAASRVPTIWNTGDAAPSPDGSRLAFVCDNGGSAICVADLDGRDFAVLTGGALLADQPAWSPDGSRIAFRGWAQGGPPGPFNPSRIWVMNADGSGKVSLTTDAAGWQANPTWSPRQADGSYRIAYSQQSLQGSHVVAHVVSMRADGADARPVTAAGEQLDDEPAWSPDGATIAFVRTGGEASGDLWLAAAAGGAERPLMASDPAGAQRAPAWSPDGAQLAFASNHDLQPGFYTWQIFTVRADGTQLVRRTHDRAEKQRPAWMRRLP
jgi:Tol biopolymer transport system component